MLVGTLVVSRITTGFATWSALVLLLAIHLAMNHAAVRSVCMRSMNRQRCNLVVSALVDKGIVLTPKQVAEREAIFEWDGVLRWNGGDRLGSCRIGTLQDLMGSLSERHPKSGSYRHLAADVSKLMSIYAGERYLLWYDGRHQRATVVLKEGARPLDQLKAWTQALLIARSRPSIGKAGATGSLAAIESTCSQASQLFLRHAQALSQAGWDVEVGALETAPGIRITCDGDDIRLSNDSKT